MTSRACAFVLSAVAAGTACNAILGVDDLVVEPPDASTDAGPTTSSSGGGGGAGGGAGCGEECAADACCDGACVDLESSAAHCGACGKACAGTDCVAGACDGECVPPLADCNASAADGCEVDLDMDPAHCGSCPEACAPGSTCAAGECVCPPTLGDCDADPAHVCEADLQTDEAHCGNCATTCAMNEDCAAGSCACAPGFLDCDGASGCEASAADPGSCGDCLTICNAQEVCNAGSCDGACNAGLTLCGASCVDLQSNPSHCGMCNAAVGPNQTCTGGMATCDPGWGNCAAAAGCETPTTSDPQHCGSCATVCKTGALCAQSVCQCPLATKDCGAACQQCCVNADCAAGNVCSAGTCVPGCPGAPLETFGDNAADTHPGVASDTWIDSGTPNQNHGATTYLHVHGLPQLGLLRFDLAAIPPTAFVCTATLRLFNDGEGSVNTLTLHRVLEAWIEGAQNGGNGFANWINRQPLVPWSQAGCGAPASCESASVGSFVPTGPAGMQYDIVVTAALVQGWVSGAIPNHGLAMKILAGNDNSELRSSESAVNGQRPSLRITYFVP